MELALALGMGDQQCLISWALMLYSLENCDWDQLSPDMASSWAEISGEMIVTAVSVAGASGVSSQLYTSLLAGLERVVVAGLAAPHLDLIVKLATDLMTDWPPSAVLPATQLVLAAMYSSPSPLTPESSLSAQSHHRPRDPDADDGAATPCGLWVYILLHLQIHR